MSGAWKRMSLAAARHADSIAARARFFEIETMLAQTAGNSPSYCVLQRRRRSAILSPHQSTGVLLAQDSGECGVKEVVVPGERAWGLLEATRGGAMVCHSYLLILRVDSSISTGVSPGTPWGWAMVRLWIHWRKGSTRGVIPAVPARNVRRVLALIGIRKGDARSGATRGMGAMLARVVEYWSVLGVAPGRRGPGGEMERADWSSRSVGAAIS